MIDAPASWVCAGRRLSLDRPLVMGILNVTPDSFSDGGRHHRLDAAVRHAERMIAEGADILDIGGESTRPGALPVDAGEERRRVAPVIAEIARRFDTPISVDTMKSAVARWALDAGACIVNDVSAGTHDPDILSAAAAASAGMVLMHMRGEPATMQNAPQYGNVRHEVREGLRERLRAAVAAGLPPEALAVDPGIGFGKTFEHNMSLLRFLDDFRTLGACLLVGISRKRFLETLTGRVVSDRLAGSLAAMVWCVLHGAQVLRVHDVQEACDAVRVAVELTRVRESKGV